MYLPSKKKQNNQTNHGICKWWLSPRSYNVNFVVFKCSQIVWPQCHVEPMEHVFLKIQPWYRSCWIWTCLKHSSQIVSKLNLEFFVMEPNFRRCKAGGGLWQGCRCFVHLLYLDASFIRTWKPKKILYEPHLFSLETYSTINP